MPKASEIFTPADQPIYTYVDREAEKLEQRLKDHLDATRSIISISGPSKTGKSVLLKKVLDADLVIPVSGSTIQSLENLWTSILSWMEVPHSTTSSSTNGSTKGVTAAAEGGLNIPVLAKGSVSGGTSYESSNEKSNTKYYADLPFNLVVKEIAKSDFVIFIDDFHYIPKTVQVEVAKQIKSLAERDVKVCVASVPHKSEDVLRANPELRGRLASIDIPYWKSDELARIAAQGFEALNLIVSEGSIELLSKEALGSPQLMQSICLNVCRAINCRETLPEKTEVKFTKENVQSALETTAETANFSALVKALHSGPKIRGAERKQFKFFDETVGDVYRAILLALTVDPPALSFSYDDLLERVKTTVTENDFPTGSSIAGSLPHIVEISTNILGDKTVIDWDDNILTIVDPYFAFYLRGSEMLKLIANSNR